MSPQDEAASRPQSNPASSALQRWAVFGAILSATSVAAGAFGAHGLRDSLDAQALGQWATASRYLMYAGLGAVLSTLASHGSRRSKIRRRGLFAAAALSLGGVVFAIALYALALGAPGLFGAVAPIGGASMVFGFLALAATLFGLGDSPR